MRGTVIDRELVQFALFLALVGFVVLFLALSAHPVDAASPAWPCYGEGWAPGDVWGPGPEDIIPLDTPPCAEPTLPPTDTAS